MPKFCCKCNEPLERIYYKIPFLCGNYCSKCVHDLYRELGLSFYTVDADDEVEDEAETQDTD